MQGLILAAGKGSRLGEYTQEIPKVMVEIDGKPLMYYAFDRMCEQKVTETIIVVGYQKEYIFEKCGTEYNGMKLRYVENDIYETTNNVYSFYLATKYIHDEVLMIEGDLLFTKNVLDCAVSDKHDCNIVVSRYNDATMNGTVVRSDGNKAVSLIVKKFQQEGFNYENVWKTVNVYYYSECFIRKFAGFLELYVDKGNLDNYYELVLGALIYLGDDDIRIVPVNENEWFEIDDENDLAIARKHGEF